MQAPTKLLNIGVYGEVAGGRENRPSVTAQELICDRKCRGDWDGIVPRQGDRDRDLFYTFRCQAPGTSLFPFRDTPYGVPGDDVVELAIRDPKRDRGSSSGDGSHALFRWNLN